VEEKNDWGITKLKVVGKYDYRQTLAAISMRMSRHCLYDAFPYSFRREIERIEPLFAVVQGTRKNLGVQVLKYEAEVFRSFREEEEFRRACAIVEQMFAPALTATVTPWSECVGEFEMDKSPGVPWTGSGFRTKGQVAEFPDEFAEYCVQAVEKDVHVVFGTVAKVEFLPIAEIKEDKVRIFSPGPFHFLMWQAHLYSQQNQQLKNFSWSGYGYNLFRGGCNHLARQFEKKKVVFDFDMPRCDKSFLLMKEVYKIRNKFLQGLTAAQNAGAEWVKRNLETVWVVLFDGTVIESDRHNPSGQLNTTTDNILYVALVIAYAMLCWCPTATAADIMRQLIKIFGDDAHGAVDAQFSGMFENKAAWFKNFIKTKFNLELKSCNVYETPAGVHWLGADYKLLHETQWYVPHYNPDRIFDAWRFTENPKLQEWQILCKLRSLLILAFPHFTLFTKLRACYAALLVSLNESKDSRVHALLRLGVPSSKELVAFYTGLEGSSLSVGSDFYDALEEVGGVKTEWMNVKDKRQGIASGQTNGQAGLAETVRKLKESKPTETGTGSGKTGSKPDEGGQAIAKRALGIARAVQGGHKASFKLAGGKGAQGKAQGNDGVARNGQQGLAGLGPVAIGRFGNALVKKSNVITYRNAAGKVVAQGTKIYGGQAIKSKGPSLAKNGHMLGAKIQEREHIDPKLGRMVQIVGHQFLGSVAALDEDRQLGERMGMHVVMPDAFGGRLLLLSEEFEQHKVNKLVVVYAPVVPATTDGAILMYFRNDVATPTLDTGNDELVHASTHPSFEQCQVWEECHMAIDPSDCMKKYFDEETGDMRLEAQGLITVEAASGIAVGTYGNLYLYYDIDFFGEELDYEVPDMPTGFLNLSVTVGAGSANALNPMIFVGAAGVAPAGAEYFNFTGTSGVLDTDFVLYGPVTIDNASLLTFCTKEDNALRTFSNGQGFYARVWSTVPGQYDLANSTVKLALFTSLAAATEEYSPSYGVETVNNGQVCFTGTDAVATTLDLRIAFKAIPVNSQ
jgi:hypothetical protein